MSDSGNDLNHPILNLTPEEKRVFGQLFQQADTDRLGVITGEVAVKFFEKTKIAPNVLGEIWQIADSENRGLLTKPGFSVALRLIGHYQAGRDPTPELGFKPAPIPKFDGVNIQPSSPAVANAQPNALQPQGTGSIRIPPLTPDKIQQYSGLFERSGAQNGQLPGETAKAIFERAGLPNEILGRIWGLADREQRGALDMTEFIIAMHLITAYKSKTMTALPSVLPPGLYDAASRRGSASARQPGPAPPGAIPRQFTGPQRTSSPLSRAPYGTPPPQAAQTTGPNWLVTPQEKAKYDSFFDSIDTSKTGYLTGDQAVRFFSDSGLPEDTLASIWDLADVRSEGQLNREEFAVAMYLIRQQRSGGAPLPAFLPAALVPPSMRNQPQSTQTTAPTFDNANNTSQLPKSASEDLFGLDASPPRSQPPALQAQTTGSSAAGRSPFDADPFAGSKTASPVSPQRTGFQPGGQGMFRPFQPSSAFGASLAAQNTGGSATSAQPQPRGQPNQPAPQQRQAPPPSDMDDLLGDNDEEQSKKLTDETTELANMSTQVGNLRNQMQEVQSKRSVNERDVASSSSQKQELQQRLAQFRAQYEQEVATVKSLEQQLAQSRESTRKLQQELAMVEGAHQDLQTQHQQVAQQLDSDQKENTSLKERISALNAEITQLRPQIDKMRSDARQQKGMVAINKKQLTTNEGERDKLNSEKNDLSKAAEEERTRSLQSPEPTSAVVSPAPSASTNPFFRKSSQQQTEGVRSPGGFMASNPSPSAFDALFGPAAASSGPSRTATPPQTSFHRSEAAPAFSAQSASSDGRPTPSATPPLSANQDYAQSGESAHPPPPPESRQFTPGMLPMRPPPSRGESVASSTRAAAPGSRINAPENVRSPTPQAEATSRNVSSPFDQHPGGTFVSSPFGGDISNDRSQVATDSKPDIPRPQLAQGPSTSFVNDLPGAFPSESPQKEIVPSTAGSGQPSSSLANTTLSDDFDSAFGGFGGPSTSKGPSDALQHQGGSANPNSEEFYPMSHEHESSDSEEENGFDDDFNAAGPSMANGAPATKVQSGEHREYAGPVAEDVARPTAPTARSTTEELPTISAQKSPPTYEQSMSPTSEVGGHPRASSSGFPPEFRGLLPSREDPTAFAGPHSVSEQPLQSPPPLGSASSLAPPPQTPASTGPDSDAYQDASSRPLSTWTDAGQTHAQPAHKSAFDDAFADFDDLDEAKTGDDKGFDFSDNRSEAEFNPSFDSPATSMMAGSSSTQQTPVPYSNQGNGFQGFDSSTNHGGSSVGSAFGEVPAGQKTPQASNHDWDAIFSGLDSPAPNVAPNFGGTTTTTGGNLGGTSSRVEEDRGFGGGATTPKAPSSPAQTHQGLPQLGRALSTGTEHDDPILKRLTGMGYPRDQALGALEKYDYDIDKAVDHLASTN